MMMRVTGVSSTLVSAVAIVSPVLVDIDVLDLRFLRRDRGSAPSICRRRLREGGFFARRRSLSQGRRSEQGERDGEGGYAGHRWVPRCIDVNAGNVRNAASGLRVHTPAA